MINIGKKIRQLRAKRNLKQVDLARALFVSPQAVSKWERSEAYPDILTLADLSRILGVTTDYLLGVTEQDQGVFEGSVFCSSIKQFAQMSQSMDSRQLAEWANVIFHHLTEAALKYDAVPVKYVGDGFLCFFSGPDHASRAVKAAIHGKKIIQNDSVVIAINSGDIYLGTIGHPDYSTLDICGDCVNQAFLIIDHVAELCKTGIGFTLSVAENLSGTDLIKYSDILIERTNSKISIFETAV